MATGLVMLLLGSLLKKLVDFVKQVRDGRDGINAVATQLLAWLGGVLLTLMVAQTEFAGSVGLGDVSLAGAGFWTQVLIGLSLASTVSFIGSDVVAAIDNTRTSKVAPLIDTPAAQAKP